MNNPMTCNQQNSFHRSITFQRVQSDCLEDLSHSPSPWTGTVSASFFLASAAALLPDKGMVTCVSDDALSTLTDRFRKGVDLEEPFLGPPRFCVLTHFDVLLLFLLAGMYL